MRDARGCARVCPPPCGACECASPLSCGAPHRSLSAGGVSRDEESRSHLRLIGGTDSPRPTALPDSPATATTSRSPPTHLEAEASARSAAAARRRRARHRISRHRGDRRRRRRAERADVRRRPQRERRRRARRRRGGVVVAVLLVDRRRRGRRNRWCGGRRSSRPAAAAAGRRSEARLRDGGGGRGPGRCGGACGNSARHRDARFRDRHHDRRRSLASSSRGARTLSLVRFARRRCRAVVGGVPRRRRRGDMWSIIHDVAEELMWSLRASTRGSRGVVSEGRPRESRPSSS